MMTFCHNGEAERVFEGPLTPPIPNNRTYFEAAMVAFFHFGLTGITLYVLC